MKAIVDKEKCIGCGQCVDVCPVSVIEVVDGIAVIGKDCIGCGACETTCPVEAISMK
jgi:ferredoxin